MSRVVCDEKLCSGCLACVVACMDQHYDETQTDAVSLRIYEKRTSQRTGMVSYITRSCLHCENAACMQVCPMKVFEKNTQGFVITSHQERCIGCRKCLQACPHDVPRFNQGNKIVKCDGCSVRVANGLEPACVRSCNTGALRWPGDRR